ncbi:butyryl-CoA dehydrogenase [Sedimentibacter acidaminivorans]|uniref:Butyryl-CoA dehydrogenase n=1 Tax=Sedimentibacter acidaminivorans TaxID=913099 RepID=A0ABS4GIQ1_9FIRM|nr:acyl-CoA dehydrogenase family protein [Sedimentibacter acidaminivorans]MBP1927417.1 butyryl-CoA dehydrogenase [Sedimentibacter acidaminivorans]
MNLELTKIQQLISRSMSDFAKANLQPIAYEDDRSGRFPEEAIEEMAKNDFFNINVPQDCGGRGTDFYSVALMAEEFGKANGAAASIAMAHIVLAIDTIARHGTLEQKEKYIPLLKKGEKLGGYAFAESGASLASGEEKVIASRSGQDYLLTGKKNYVANGGVANIYIVIAQVSEEEGQNNISAFIVEAEGVKVTRNIDKLGLRAFPTTELEFNNTKAQLLGTENQGLKIAAEIQARFDIASAAIAIGIGEAALEETSNHCKTRIQFGAPIGKLQAVQWMLAEMATNLHTLKTLTYQGVACVDSNGDYTKEATFIKMFARKAAFEIGTNAVQIHGGTGYSREANIERYFRDLKGLFLVENISEYPEKIIAGNILK